MTKIEKTNIKEMFNIMGKATETNLCHKECFIDTEFDNECSLCRAATALHKAGYRKQSDTAKEFAEKVIELDGHIRECCIQAFCDIVDIIAASFGKEE